MRVPIQLNGFERGIGYAQLQHDGCNIVEIVGGKFHTFQLGHVGGLHIWNSGKLVARKVKVNEVGEPEPLTW